MKCEHCKQGDPKFGHNFKNQTMLNTHIKHKHPEDPEEDNNTDPNLDDIGAGANDPDEPKTGMCSDCGADIEGKPSKCFNCGAGFE